MGNFKLKITNRKHWIQVVVVHTFNPSTQGGRVRQISCDFKASLVYRVSKGRARDTQRNPVSKNKNENEERGEGGEEGEGGG